MPWYHRRRLIHNRHAQTILLTAVLLEKEKKQIEYLCMAGLPSHKYWFSWFIMFVIKFGCLTLVVVTLTHFGNVFERSSPSLLFVFLLLFR
jgi:hypothetical protein